MSVPPRLIWGVDRDLVSIVRKLLPYTTAATVIAVIYVVWVFASRWSESRRVEQTAQAREAAAAKEVTDIYGSGHLKILNFYVTPGIVARGNKALICYGVVNAKTVRLEPPVTRVYPAISYCFEVTPQRETRYTLTVEDGHGHTETQSFVLEVK